MNLIEIKQNHLYNVLTADMFGVYTNTQAGPASAKHLLIKALGFEFVAKGTAGVDFGYAVADAPNGEVKVGIYPINNNAPNNPSNYPFSVKVDPQHKNPGVDKALRFGAAVYGDNYNVSVSGAKITTASLIAMIDDVADQCYSDETVSSWLKIGVAFNITGYSAGNNVTLNAEVFDAATIDDLIDAINAGNKAYAYKTSATSYVVIFKDQYDLNNPIASEATVDADAPYLGIIGLDAEVQFDTYFSAGLRGDAIIAQGGYWPFMTSDDITRLVRYRGNNGSLSILKPVDLPIAGTEYVKLYIWTNSGIYSNHIPGGEIKHVNGVNIFIPKEQLTAHVWKDADWNNDAPVNPDKDITELLDYWKL